MFHAGSTAGKIATYVVNGLGLVFLVLGSAEIQTFLAPDVIAYALASANGIKTFLEKGPLALLPPKA